jgi:RNA polymerase sigma-70 factor, ECF subfamily
VTDAQILERFRRGDPEAAAALYDRHAPGLYAYVRSLCANAQDSEDIVQESFLKLLDYVKRAPIDSFQALLFTTARNLVINDARRARVRRGVLPAPVEPDVPPEPETLAVLRSAMERLPDDQREVVVLKVWSGLTFAEIGAITGAGAATVASRYRYALSKVSDSLAKGHTDER